MHLLFLSLLLITANANAVTWGGTGNENLIYARTFLNYVENGREGAGWEELVKINHWQGLVIGHTNGYNDKAYKYAICYPSKATAGQNMEIAAKYLIEHVELRAETVADLIWRAHQEAFGLQAHPDCYKTEAYWEEQEKN